MQKDLFNSYFTPSDSNKKLFSVANYNTKKNVELKNQLHTINFNRLDELYTLLEQYQQKWGTKSAARFLKIIKENIDVNTYDIKGILYNHHASFSLINKYTDSFLDGLKYDIKFELYKIENKPNNKVLFLEKNKYFIIISNINEESKKFLENNFLYYFRPVLLFTNLKASLEIDYLKNKVYFLFKNTYKTKIYMEINKIKDIEKAKKNFLSSGIYIDNLKLNEFSYIDWINTENLFNLKNNKIKNNIIKKYNLEIVIDLKTYLEIETDSIYIENLKEEFFHYYPLKKNNINICCYVKSIKEDKRKKIVSVILENLYDLNNVILEIPKDSKTLDSLYINCVYIFTNLIVFLDEKMNIKLTLQKNKSEKSEIIFLYFLIDPEKYYNKKLNDILIQNQFSQLLSIVKNNKIIRTIHKYFVVIDKINYINLYISNETNEISYYDGLMQCSDGTSNGFLKIKGNDISNLNKLEINVNYYLNNNEMNINGKISISPYLDENIQLIVIGNPVMGGIKELSFVDIYENINILKKPTNNNDDLIDFDLLITKNEFTTINGSFLKQSKQLEVIPIINVYKLFNLDEYINLVELQKNKGNII